MLAGKLNINIFIICVTCVVLGLMLYFSPSNGVLDFTLREIFFLVMNILLLGWGIYERTQAQAADALRVTDQDGFLSRIRGWHKHAEGIKNALLPIAQNPSIYSSKEDISSAVNSVAQSAVSLEDGLCDAAFYDPKEVKRRREQNQKNFQKLIYSSVKAQNSSSGE